MGAFLVSNSMQLEFYRAEEAPGAEDDGDGDDVVQCNGGG